MMEWQPIETAPKDEYKTVLLAFVGEMDGEPFSFSCVGHWLDPLDDGPDYMGHDGGWCDVNYGDLMPGRSLGRPDRMYAARQPTHWMPLPPPPA